MIKVLYNIIFLPKNFELELYNAVEDIQQILYLYV